MALLVLCKICKQSLQPLYHPCTLVLSQLLIILTLPLLSSLLHSTPLTLLYISSILLSSTSPLHSFPSPPPLLSYVSSVLPTVPSWVLAEKAWCSAGLLIEAQNNKRSSLGTCQSHTTYSARNVLLDGDQVNLIIRELQVTVTGPISFFHFSIHFSFVSFLSLLFCCLFVF